MYRYSVWPGAYSFKNEVSLFLLYIRDQFDELIKKVNKTEEAIEEK